MQIVAIWLKNCYRREKSKLQPKSGLNKKSQMQLVDYTQEHKNRPLKLISGL